MYSSNPLAFSVLESGGWAAPSLGRVSPGKEFLPVTQEAVWAFVLLKKITEHHAPTGIQSLAYSSRSESLHRLSYPGLRNYITSNVCWEVKTSRLLCEKATYNKVTISDWHIAACTGTRLNKLIIYITKKYIYIIIIFIYCNWVVTRWQWFCYMYTKHEIGYYYI